MELGNAPEEVIAGGSMGVSVPVPVPVPVPVLEPVPEPVPASAPKPVVLGEPVTLTLALKLAFGGALASSVALLLGLGMALAGADALGDAERVARLDEEHNAEELVLGGALPEGAGLSETGAEAEKRAVGEAEAEALALALAGALAEAAAQGELEGALLRLPVARALPDVEKQEVNVAESALTVALGRDVTVAEEEACALAEAVLPAPRSRVILNCPMPIPSQLQPEMGSARTSINVPLGRSTCTMPSRDTVARAMQGVVLVGGVAPTTAEARRRGAAEFRVAIARRLILTPSPHEHADTKDRAMVEPGKRG